jgi:hypothetical protein
MVRQQDIKKLVVSSSPKTDVIGFKFNRLCKIEISGNPHMFLITLHFTEVG